jgi:hypothetical protein
MVLFRSAVSSLPGFNPAVALVAIGSFFHGFTQLGIVRPPVAGSRATKGHAAGIKFSRRPILVPVLLGIEIAIGIESSIYSLSISITSTSKIFAPAKLMGSARLPAQDRV